MVKERCLIAVRPSDSLTPTDRDMVEEKRETDKLSLPPTSAQKADIRRTIESRRGAENGTNEIVGLVRGGFFFHPVDIENRDQGKTPQLNLSDTLFLLTLIFKNNRNVLSPRPWVIMMTMIPRTSVARSRRLIFDSSRRSSLMCTSRSTMSDIPSGGGTR